MDRARSVEIAVLLCTIPKSGTRLSTSTDFRRGLLPLTFMLYKMSVDIMAIHAHLGSKTPDVTMVNFEDASSKLQGSKCRGPLALVLMIKYHKE
jgi:hypothetical protein